MEKFWSMLGFKIDLNSYSKKLIVGTLMLELLGIEWYVFVEKRGHP